LINPSMGNHRWHKNLSQVAAPDAFFAARPCDMTEQRRRSERIRYTFISSLDSVLIFLPVGSRASRDSRGHYFCKRFPFSKQIGLGGVPAHFQLALWIEVAFEPPHTIWR